jgi:biotin operon repressor
MKRGENQTWEMLGPNLGLTDIALTTLDLVRAAPSGMSGITLSEKLSITRQSAWERLDLLIEKGVAIKRMGKVYAK